MRLSVGTVIYVCVCEEKQKLFARISVREIFFFKTKKAKE
jgi:hypothetical protein